MSAGNNVLISKVEHVFSKLIQSVDHWCYRDTSQNLHDLFMKQLLIEGKWKNKFPVNTFKVSHQLGRRGV